MKVCPACGAEYADDAAFCARDRTALRPSGVSQGIVGQVIGERYQVERRLGEGGMGQVYLARHVLMGRPCALKVMTPALSSNADALGRFNREATNAARISHPNVCAIYDFGLTAEGIVYLAMELVEGESLAALADQGPMPLSRAAAIVTQAAAGLQAAHDLGIVHRDLKPDNIMVARVRGHDRVKLVDFGIAKAMEGVEASAEQRVTRTGFVVGTPEYMAPEQLAGDPLDGRADQYALALVFYRLVTGRLPFDGDSAQETMVQRLTTPPRPLAAARPNAAFPAGLQPVIDTALARQPRDRYETVSAFASALGSAISADGERTAALAAPPPALAPMPPALPPTRVARGRRRWGVAVAGATVVVAVGIASAIMLDGRSERAGARGSLGSDPAPPPSPSTPPPPPESRQDTSRIERSGVAPSPAPASPAVSDARSATGTPRTAGAGLQATPQVKADSPLAALNVAQDSAADRVPDLDDLEDPGKRVAGTRLARRVLASPRAPRWQRVRSAVFLGQVMLQAGKRDSALYFYCRAYRLDPQPVYLQTIRQFGDSGSLCP